MERKKKPKEEVAELQVSAEAIGLVHDSQWYPLCLNKHRQRSKTWSWMI